MVDIRRFNVKDYKNIEEAIREETKEQEVSLWGQKLKFTPVLAKEKIGDGKQLVLFGTIDQRPRYWLLLIDSKTNLEENDYNYESLLHILEREFGSYDEYKDEDIEYPIVELISGCHWESIYGEDLEEKR